MTDGPTYRLLYHLRIRTGYKCTESVATSQGLIVLTLPWNPHTCMDKRDYPIL